MVNSGYYLASIALHDRCPACQRIADKVPAAYLTIRGKFFKQHRQELLNLIDNYAQRERQAHPRKGIMNTEKLERSYVLNFTDAHLARGIGDALQRAYGGEFEYRYSKGDMMLRVTWRR